MKHTFVVLFLLAFFVRMGFAILAPDLYQSFGDTEEYLEVAHRLCERSAYPFEHIALPTFRAPGFPFILAILSGCFRWPAWWLKFALISLDACGAVLGARAIARWCRKQGELRGILFGIAYAVYPLFVQESVTLQSETPTQIAMIASLYLFSRTFEPHGVLKYFHRCAAVLSGASIGIAILTRPSALLLLFLPLCGAMFARGYRRRCVEVIVGACLLVLPWSFYATSLTGKMTLVNDSFCYSVYRGARLELLDVYNAVDEESFRTAAAHSEAVLRDVEREVPAHAWCRAAVEEIRKDPAAEVRLAFTKLWAFYRPWPHRGAHASYIISLVGAIVAGLYALFFVALLQRSSDYYSRLTKWSVAAYVLLMGLFHMPHQVSNRYRVPFVDPVLLATVAVYLRPRTGTSEVPGGHETGERATF